MARQPSQHPTDGELEILQILWDSGPLSLGDLCTALRNKREVATTTVATMLKVMLEKQLVRRSPGARAAQWSARVTRSSAAAGMIDKLVDRVFDGSAQRLVAHLIENEPLSDEDRRELRRLLNSRAASNPKDRA